MIGYDQIIRYTRTGKTASKAAKIRGSSFHSAYLRPPASTKAVRRAHRSRRTVLAGTRTLRAPGPVTCSARRRVAVVRRMFAAVLRRCLCEATHSPLRGSTAQGRCCRNALLHRETVLGTVRGRRAPGGAEETTAQGRGTGIGRSERPHAAFVHRILRWTIWPRCCAEERKPSMDQSQTGLWLRAIAMRAHRADSLMSQSHLALSHLQPPPS